MDNFIQAFSEGFEEEERAESKDESPASRVNVVLRSARRFVEEPAAERAYFEHELKAYETGLEQTLAVLEDLHDQADENEAILLEVAHQDLESVMQLSSKLHTVLSNPDRELLDQISSSLVVPTYRLLLAREALERLSDTRHCPYCSQENARQASRCEQCGKPLSVPDPLHQEGELIAVPPNLSRLLELCFQVASDPEALLEPWRKYLGTVRSQFSAALQRVELSLKKETQETVVGEFQEMKQGLEGMLAGFEELGTFEESLDAETLDKGWVKMMSGFKLFKNAGDRLAAHLSPK